MAEEERKTRAKAASGWRKDTLVTHAGLSPKDFHGFVNPPVVRASTVLFDDVETMSSRRGARYSYGLTNTPTIEALTSALTALEGKPAEGTVLIPSGLAAVTLGLLVAARPGRKLLIPDNVYGPTRRFCDETLPTYGVATTYYDPLIGGGIAALLDAASGLLLRGAGLAYFRDAGHAADDRRGEGGGCHHHDRQYLGDATDLPAA